jgi:excisionase family DNA binding protein
MTNTQSAPPALLSVKDVARILGTSDVRVRRLVRDGRLRSVRLSAEGYHRFDPREIDRFITETGAS